MLDRVQITKLLPPSVEITLCPKDSDCDGEAYNSKHDNAVGKRRNWVNWDLKE